MVKPVNLFQSSYRIYDLLMSKLFFLPIRYCSQCEKKIRFWVYEFEGLVHCQDCADLKWVELEAEYRQSNQEPPSH